MPEIPDLTVYVEHLERRLVGRAFAGVRVRGPNLLRTASPPPGALTGRHVSAVRRVGKRLVLVTDGPCLALHLMISGRLHWKPPAAPLAGRRALAAFDFEHGTLTLTEASTHQRAALHVFADAAGPLTLDAGGLEPVGADPREFAAALRRHDHTLKRALTDPGILAGIGNSYSDEILHAAGLSPFKRTAHLSDEEATRLHAATQAVLAAWTGRLRAEAGDEFPEHVTAFHDGMAVHGRHRLPCPACGAPVQRIVYADREANYCARCQTDGRLLADRALSRLLRGDWPRTLEELEERHAGTASPAGAPRVRRPR